VLSGKKAMGDVFGFLGRYNGRIQQQTKRDAYIQQTS